MVWGKHVHSYLIETPRSSLNTSKCVIEIEVCGTKKKHGVGTTKDFIQEWVGMAAVGVTS